MSELLNLIGLSTGVALYAMLLTMVVWAHRAPFSPIELGERSHSYAYHHQRSVIGNWC